jgi:serine/threonine protein kinase
MIDQRVGNYRIVRKLGEGGMGVVYEGVHEQIGRRVAIKVLHPDLSRHADTVSRFLTEAKLVSKIQHPGVVYTFEYGQLPDQTAYIVMEYLEGESIAKRLKLSGGRLGASAVNLGRQIASGLAAAHAQGIVHRDLKPDKVLPFEKMGLPFPGPSERAGESLARLVPVSRGLVTC